MPDPEESSPSDERGALQSFDQRLDAFDAGRKRKPGSLLGAGAIDGKGAADGYRLLGQMLGGVLGGLGIGWLVDHFAHTGPWGVVGGLLIGATLSIIATVNTASAISARAEAALGARASVALAGRDEDED